MAAQGGDHESRGDIMRRLREADRDREMMKTARRLENSSIGRGGIRIHDEGSIRSDNFDGNPADVLGEPGTEGWALGAAGLVVNNGVFRGEVRSDTFEEGVDGYQLKPTGDATFSGTVKVAGGDLEVNDAGEVRWLDDAGNVRLKIAKSDEDGIDTTKLIVFDENGNDRVTLGEVNDGGTVHEGVIVKNAAGKGMVTLTTPTETAGSGFAYASDQQAIAVASDQMVIARPGATNDVLIRINEADGIRIALDTDSDGVQSGQMTAGPADSAGSGFRTVRIPN